MLLKVINLGGRNGKGGGRNKKPNPLKAFGISSERVNPVSMKNMENQCEAGFQCKGTGAITSRDVAQYHKRVGAESRNNRWVTPAQMKNHGQLTCCGACWNWGAEQIRKGAPAGDVLTIQLSSILTTKIQDAKTINFICSSTIKVLVERCCQAWQLAQGGCDAMQ